MKLIPLILTSLFFSSTCFSQSLFQKLNGTETAFHFTSNQDSLSVTSQGIISKGVKESKQSSEYDHKDSSYTNYEYFGESQAGGYGYGYGRGYGYGYGFGYGFQAYHLDFTVKNKINTVTIPFNELTYNHIEVNLVDKENKNILKLKSTKHAIQESIDNRGYTAFSINLNDIPISLLNETARIDIKKVKTRLFTKEELKKIKDDKIQRMKPKSDKAPIPFYLKPELVPSFK